MASSELLNLSFQISFLLSSYVIPLSLISFLYVGMLSRLWKGTGVGKGSKESRYKQQYFIARTGGIKKTGDVIKRE